MTEPRRDYAGLRLPDGGRLLHIGPHKTGTTSLQAALFTARAALLEQGVRHIGRTRNPASAVRAVTGQPAPTSTDTPPSMRYWDDLVREFRSASESRVVLSSEFFSWAKPDVIKRIATDLDRERLHVVVTLRPLGKILPSQWQQNVQAGAMLDYEAWLRRVFGQQESRAADSFWMLHEHDRLIARWAAVLGTDRLTAVVVDEKDHGMLLRVFEGFLGLRDGTLVPDRDLSNRSMTVPEVEAVRAFNVAANKAGISRAVHAKTMRFGAAMHMKLREPDPTEDKIDTPQWALDAARERDLEIVPAIEAQGVRVVGDLATLTAQLRSKADPGGIPVDVTIPPRIAAEMALGVLLASGAARERGAGSTWVEPIEVARVSTWQLVGVLVWRVRAGVLRRVRSLIGRPRA